MSRSDIVRRLRKRKIGVLMGGWSSEREISLLSGQRVLNSLKGQGFQAVGIDISRNFTEQIKRAKIDLAFVILHGRPGEDGTVQGYLDLLGIPYTGSGVTASAICIDKVITKMLFERVGIPTPPYFVIGPGADVQAVVAEAVEALAPSKSFTRPQEVREQALQIMACRGAVKAGEALAPEAIQSLLVQLDEIPVSSHCPHGRPLWRLMSYDDIRQSFRR